MKYEQTPQIMLQMPFKAGVIFPNERLTASKTVPMAVKWLPSLLLMKNKIFSVV